MHHSLLRYLPSFLSQIFPPLYSNLSTRLLTSCLHPLLSSDAPALQGSLISFPLFLILLTPILCPLSTPAFIPEHAEFSHRRITWAVNNSGLVSSLCWVLQFIRLLLMYTSIMSGVKCEQSRQLNGFHITQHHNRSCTDLAFSCHPILMLPICMSVINL